MLESGVCFSFWGFLLLSHNAPHTFRTTWLACFSDLHPTHFSSQDNFGNVIDN